MFLLQSPATLHWPPYRPQPAFLLHCGPILTCVSCAQDQIHTLQELVQNANAGPLVQKSKNFKTVTAERLTKCGSFMGYRLRAYEAGSAYSYLTQDGK